MASNISAHIETELKEALENVTGVDISLYSPWVIPSSQWSLQWTPIAMDFHGDLALSSSNWQFTLTLIAPEDDAALFAEQIDPTVEHSIMNELTNVKTLRFGAWTFSREAIGGTGGLQLVAICQFQLLGVGSDD